MAKSNLEVEQTGLKVEFEHLSRELLLKGKDQYGWPPWTYEFRSAAFHTETTFFFSLQNNLS